MYAPITCWRATGSARPPLVAEVLHEVARARAVAPLEPAAGRQRDPLVRERRLGHAPAEVLLADQVLGGNAHVGEEHLVEARVARHVADRANLDAGEVHRDDEVRDAAVLRHVVAGARDEDAELGVVGERRPDLLAVDAVDVAVALGAGTEVREVGARARLAEELAPQLLAREHRAAGSAASARRCRARR